jgi:hypothetical protein
VHLPEQALAARGFGRFGGSLCMGMYRGDRKVSEHKAEAVRHLRLNRIDDRVRDTAVRAFVIAVLNQRHGPGRGPADVIALRQHWRCQGCAPLCRVHRFS